MDLKTARRRPRGGGDRRRGRRPPEPRRPAQDSSRAGGAHGGGRARSLRIDGRHPLEQIAQAVSLAIRPADEVPAFTLWNDVPVSGRGDDVVVELGDFYAGEQCRIQLDFEVPGRPELGAANICKLELRWVDLASMTEKVATVPVNVNVVPGDVAAGRVPQATVRDELAFLRL
jgi:hypothetical protein